MVLPYVRTIATLLTLIPSAVHPRGAAARQRRREDGISSETEIERKWKKRGLWVGFDEKSLVEGRSSSLSRTSSVAVIPSEKCLFAGAPISLGHGGSVPVH